jgi:hypothetical protein
MTTETNSLSLQYYAVGLFDLLGQQDFLRNLRSLPDHADATALAKTREDLKNTYGAVTGMRNLFSDSFSTYVRNPVDVSHLTPEQQQVYHQMNSNPIQSQSFSDSIVVFLSLCTTDDAKLPVRGILGILVAAALTFIGLLGEGHPIRGGIDVGLGFQPSANEIYGPALSRAYALESRIANYPRIVVGDELIRYLNEMGAQQTIDEFSSQSKKVATSCIECLTYDEDGIPFVDYLGPYFRSIIGDVVQDASFIDKAYSRVVEFSARYKEEKNSQLAFRYVLLRNYFEDRLPLWADLPRK